MYYKMINSLSKIQKTMHDTIKAGKDLDNLIYTKIQESDYLIASLDSLLEKSRNLIQIIEIEEAKLQKENATIH